MAHVPGRLARALRAGRAGTMPTPSPQAIARAQIEGVGGKNARQTCIRIPPLSFSLAVFGGLDG